jgi:hypothetical protein
MTIEIKTGVRYEYKCFVTGDIYVEQRNIDEPQFVTKSPAGGDYILVNQTEFTYEQEVPEPEVFESVTE